ncbi:dihydrofolate reductase family protein [Microbacterium sp. JB110]|uniref:dihydrofolate reductase family protein n=1 Tax=Microbacterium sp. JB110 TaxID=2024477 RepID=UPI00097F623F|nr:dihydrofolate reductase family protein [Microbacterium sp. JB110]RCS61915.1 deaminase [Microbacterium sp. JB110]SJM66599.1 Dihydrofolate reductase [Frigoribacterium sp. JB110]
MGTLVYSMQVSLDGFVADAAGEFASWARPDEQVLAAINDEHSRVSTYLLGRRMYQTMAVWETNPEVIEQSPQSTEFAQIWQRADKVVFSRTLEAVDTSHTQLRTRFDPEEVTQMKADAQGNVTIDGPTVATHAIRHGLVDRIDVLLCPVVVGDGLRFLPDHRLDLDLQHEQRFDNGMVQLRYDVLASHEISA